MTTPYRRPGTRVAVAIAVAAAVVAAVAFAETGAAEAALKSLGARPAVRGSFVQTKHIPRLGRDLVSKGEFIVSPAKGVYWKVLSPFPSEIIMHADRMVQRSPGGKESVMEAAGNPVFKMFADTFRALFAGRLDAIRDNFAVTTEALEKGGWRINLTPRDKSVQAVVSAILVEGAKTIERLTIKETSGDSVRYDFTILDASEGLDAREEALFAR